MDGLQTKTSFNLSFTQIVWVVKDINATLIFFKNTMDITNFGNLVTIRAQDFKATYYRKPADEESLVSMAYSGRTLLNRFSRFQGKCIPGLS